MTLSTLVRDGELKYSTKSLNFMRILFCLVTSITSMSRSPPKKKITVFNYVDLYVYLYIYV